MRARVRGRTDIAGGRHRRPGTHPARTWNGTVVGRPTIGLRSCGTGTVRAGEITRGYEVSVRFAGRSHSGDGLLPAGESPCPPKCAGGNFDAVSDRGHPGEELF